MKKLKCVPLQIDKDTKLKAIGGSDEYLDVVDGLIAGNSITACISSKEAERIGNWFLKFAEWSKK